MSLSYFWLVGLIADWSIVLRAQTVRLIRLTDADG